LQQRVFRFFRRLAGELLVEADDEGTALLVGKTREESLARRIVTFEIAIVTGLDIRDRSRAR